MKLVDSLQCKQDILLVTKWIYSLTTSICGLETFIRGLCRLGNKVAKKGLLHTCLLLLALLNQTSWHYLYETVYYYFSVRLSVPARQGNYSGEILKMTGWDKTRRRKSKLTIRYQSDANYSLKVAAVTLTRTRNNTVTLESSCKQQRGYRVPFHSRDTRTYDRGSSSKWCARTPVTTTSLQAAPTITELSYLRTFNHLEARPWVVSVL